VIKSFGIKMIEKSKVEKKNFSPPVWLVICFPNVMIDSDRAKRLWDLRIHLLEKYGPEDERVNVKNLWLLALDLMLNYMDEVFANEN
jgi:hypothetical protein